jgi:hypothetical protein
VVTSALLTIGIFYVEYLKEIQEEIISSIFRAFEMQWETEILQSPT